MFEWSVRSTSFSNLLNESRDKFLILPGKSSFPKSFHDTAPPYEKLLLRKFVLGFDYHIY